MRSLLKIYIINTLLFSFLILSLTIPGWAIKKSDRDISQIISIKSADEFLKIVESSGKKLLVFDLYADWCRPCKILSPMLEDIAGKTKENVGFYKINVDKLRQLATSLKVKGIPHMVFIKNKTVVFTLTGLYPEDKYVETIKRFVD